MLSLRLPTTSQTRDALLTEMELTKSALKLDSHQLQKKQAGNNFHTDIHTNTHKHTHTYIHTYIYIYTHCQDKKRYMTALGRAK